MSGKDTIKLLCEILEDHINASTWDKGLPKYYMDGAGWLVEHWKDGRIIKLKKLKLNN